MTPDPALMVANRAADAAARSETDGAAGVVLPAVAAKDDGTELRSAEDVVATAAQLQAERLAAIPSDRYDRLVRLASMMTGAPISALKFLGHDAQYTVAAIGLPLGPGPLTDSFFLALTQGSAQTQPYYEVHDLAADPRYAHNSMVSGPPFARFFAGCPLHSAAGQVVGVLAVLDVVPRSLTKNERTMLMDLSALIEHELANQEDVLRAAEVQQRLLPTADPDLPGIEVAGRVVQAREAGGDFFDWQVIEVEDGMDQLQIVLADVMGKGLAAALLASEVRAVIRGHSRYADIAAAMGRATTTTKHDLESNSIFVTTWMGRIDPTNGRIEYIDAGHGLAFIAGPRGVHWLKQDYLPLGIPVEQHWRKGVERLDIDEYLVCVSDGVYDALGGLHATATIDSAFSALEELLRLGGALSCAEICNFIVEYALAQEGMDEHGDDCTAVVVRRVPLSGWSPR